MCRKTCIYNKPPILFCIQDLGCIADFFKSRRVSEIGKVQATDHQRIIIKKAQEVINKDNKVSHICLLGYCLF